MYKILLVDDEKIIVDSLRSYLAERFDMEYHSAQSANEAIEILKNSRFDIVITDISMPGISGLDLVDYIKKRWPDCQIIVLTGFEVFQYAYRAHQYPGVSFLLKIEEYETIAERIKTIISNLDKDRAYEQQYADLEERIVNMLPMVRWNIVERALRYGESLPDDQECHQISLLLRSEAPSMLIGGKICGTYQQKDKMRILDKWTLLITNQFTKCGLTVYTHLNEQTVFWIVQSGKSEPDENEMIYIQETISHLVENCTEQILALVISPAFVPWTEISHAYSDAKRALDCLYQPEMCLIQTAVNTKSEKSERFITIDCLNQLSELFFGGKHKQFKDHLSNELTPMRHIHNLSESLPHPTVSAVTMLVSNILHVFDLPEWPLNRFGKILLCHDYTDGNQWVDDVLHLVDQLVELTDYSRKNESDALIAAIDSYICENYNKDISLSSLASHVHYNPSYLSRLYKERKGINVVARINSVRLEHACDMLKNTNQSIQEISHETGFYSANYFSKVFRKSLKMSPADYRMRIAEKDKDE